MVILTIHNFHRKESASRDDQVFKSETSLLEEHGHEVIRYTVSNDKFDDASIMESYFQRLKCYGLGKNHKAVQDIIRRKNPNIVIFILCSLSYHLLFFMQFTNPALRRYYAA